MDFTIGICTRNRPEFLRQAVRSAFNQNYNEQFEIVICDDCSNYDVEALLNEELTRLNKKSIPIKLLKNSTTPKENSENIKDSLGEAASRNAIIRNSNGNYIIWLDDDDLLISKCLTSYASAIKENNQAEVFFSNLVRTDENLNPVKEYTYRDIPPELMVSSLLLGSIVPNGGSCIKRTVFKKIGLYDETYEVGTDYQFWARAAIQKIQFKHVTEVLYIYRAHSENAALDKEDDRFFKNNARVCELILRNSNPEVLTPFFEWKTARQVAEFQLLTTCLILGKKNKDRELFSRAFNSIKSRGDLAEYLRNPQITKVFTWIDRTQSISFDEAAQLLAFVVKLGPDLNNGNNEEVSDIQTNNQGSEEVSDEASTQV